MTSVGGWAPEPVLGDALAGPDGTFEPVQADPAAGRMRYEAFPDALSGVLGSDTRPAAPAVVLAYGATNSGTVLPGAPVAPRPWSDVAPVRQATQPVRQMAQPVRQVAPDVRQVPWPGHQFAAAPPPRSPGGQHPLPRPQLDTGTQSGTPHLQVGSQPAAPLPRKPTIGYVPSAGGLPANASPARPPAYLPGNAGLAQIKALVQRARQPTPAGGSRVTAKHTASAIWGVLLVLVIVLITTGLLEKIITAIANLWQGT